MDTRHKIGFISQLSYGPNAKEQERDLLEFGVHPANIFRATQDSILDACKACRPGHNDLVVVSFERVMGKQWGAALALLDEKGANLYSVSEAREYNCDNGSEFAALKAVMDKGQTAKARANQTWERRGGAPEKLTARDLEKAEKMLARGDSQRQVAEHFGVASNYFTRKGITVASAKAKYDK